MFLSRWTKPILFVFLLVFGLSIPGFSAAGGGDGEVKHFAPAFPDPPYQFKGNQIAVLVFKTSPEVLQKLVPKPLMPLPSNLIFIYFSKLTVVYGSITYPYLEVAIGVPVMYQGIVAYFYPLLYLDKTMAVTIGREVWGYHKKEGDITFKIEGNKITGTLERLGTRLINFDFTIGEKLPADTPQPNFPPYCLKIIPSVVKGAPPDVHQITSTVIRDKKVHELYRGTGTLEFKSWEFDPLGDIPVLEIVSGSYSVGDMVFDYGKVIHDYLKEPETGK
jgi:acetoacetate decarboxylase